MAIEQDIQDLIRYGLLEDPQTWLAQEQKKITQQRGDIIKYYQNLMQEKSDAGLQETSQYARQRITQEEERMQEQLSRAENRFQSLLQRNERLAQSPMYQRELSDIRISQLREQAAQEAAQQKQQTETMQRESAERQSARFRARGSRASGRPMLSAARMAPEQTMAPQQPLGAFMPK